MATPQSAMQAGTSVMDFIWRTAPKSQQVHEDGCLGPSETTRKMTVTTPFGRRAVPTQLGLAALWEPPTTSRTSQDSGAASHRAASRSAGHSESRGDLRTLPPTPRSPHPICYTQRAVKLIMKTSRTESLLTPASRNGSFGTPRQESFARVVPPPLESYPSAPPSAISRADSFVPSPKAPMVPSRSESFIPPPITPSRSESFIPSRSDSFIPPPVASRMDSYQPSPKHEWQTLSRVDSFVPSPKANVATATREHSTDAAHAGQLSSPGKAQDRIDMREFLDPPGEHDKLDQKVRAFLLQHPQVCMMHSLRRKTHGVYDIDGREVGIAWQPSSEPWLPGRLDVIDGPLRQPLLDYLGMTEANAEYDTRRIEKTSSLHHVPKWQRMTFDDKDAQYTRLQAMKVAKEQACIREQAAVRLKKGRGTDEDDLVKRYNKALSRKLPERRGFSPSPAPHDAESSTSSDTTNPPDQDTPCETPTQVITQEQRPPIPAAPASVADTKRVPIAEQARAFPLVAFVTPRGISLNGVPASPSPSPSFVPPPLPSGAISPAMPGTPSYPRMGRSWSGSCALPCATPRAGGVFAHQGQFVAPGIAVVAQHSRGPSPVPVACGQRFPNGPSPKTVPVAFVRRPYSIH